MICESFRETLLQESQALRDCAGSLDASEIKKAIHLILNATGKVLVCGVGKSGLVGAKIAATLASTGTPSLFMHPTEAMHGDLGMLQRGDVVLAISYSGESEEVLALVPHICRLKIPLITMSCSKYSSLSQRGDAFLSIKVACEACPLNVAPTTSTTLTLAMGDALAIALMQQRGFTKSDFASFHPGGSLGRQLFVCAKDIMKTQNLPLIAPELPLKEAIVVMSKGRLGSAILVKDQQLYGILSDGDLRRAMMCESFSLEAKSETYASLNPYYCDDEDKLAVDILHYIERHKIQLLVITDKQKRIRGAIHLHHLIEAKINTGENHV